MDFLFRSCVLTDPRDHSKIVRDRKHLIYLSLGVDGERTEGWSNLDRPIGRSAAIDEMHCRLLHHRHSGAREMTTGQRRSITPYLGRGLKYWP